MPLATLLETSLTVHRLFAVALLVLSFVIAILSIVARSRPEQLEKAIVFARLGDPIVGVVVITGAYMMIEGNVELLQGWVLGGIALAFLYVALLRREWLPRAREIHQQATRANSGEDAHDGTERELLAGIAVALIAITIIAIWVMENMPG